MAGRKATPKPDLLSMLLEKMGVPQKKKKTGKRKKRPRPPVDEAAYTDGYAPPASPYAPMAPVGEAGSPFGEYTQESGLGFDSNYEAAAAAGYAPPNAASDDAFANLVQAQEPAAELPRFFDEPSAPPPPPEPGKLFSEEALDNSLDALFSGLESGTLGGDSDSGLGLGFGEPEPAPVPNNVVNFPTPTPAPAPAPAPTPRPEPIMPKVPSGPLVAEAPAATLAPSQPSDFSRPGKPVQVPDILPLSQGVDLRALLGTIDRTPGVAGSLLVGHDGLIIMTTLPADVDRDYLGAQVCNLFTATGVQSHKMQRGELRRMILETASGVMLVTAADMGILVVVSQDGQAMDTATVMGAIAGAIGHS